MISTSFNDSSIPLDSSSNQLSAAMMDSVGGDDYDVNNGFKTVGLSNPIFQQSSNSSLNQSGWVLSLPLLSLLEIILYYYYYVFHRCG